MEFSLPLYPKELSLRTVVSMVLLFAAYLGTAQAVHLLFPTSIAPALIWPPIGIALAAMVLEGYAVWPAILLASLANSLLSQNMPFLLMAVIAVANVVQTIAGTWVLRRLSFQPLMARLNDVLALIFVSIATTMIAPLTRVVELVATHAILPGGSAISALGNWWTGEILSVIVVTPFLVRWIAYPRVKRLAIEWLEIIIAVGGMVLIDVLLFWTHASQARGVPIVYLLLVPLIWIALRIGPRIMTLALFLNALVAIWGTAFSAGAGNVLPLGERLFQAEIFIIMISIIFLMLCAIAEDRKNYANDLARHVGRLEDALAQIKKEDDAKNRFIATLAHELRNPLAPLLSSLELLNADPQKSDDTRIAANDMTLHVRTMRHLLDDLLDISRISRGKLTLQKEHTELHPVIDQSVRVVKGIMKERNHTLTVSIPDTAILLEADPVRLEQIVVNLLNNAAKYTPDGGRIHLSVSAANGSVRISVKDNGIGIDPMLQHRIFEPFLQLEENIQKLSGLGIGLSLTKNLVDIHGGTIEVKSEGEGKGSEFIVELPLQNLAAPVETDTAATLDRSRVFRILLVDDNRAAANALGKLLDRAGHVVKTAYSGAEALDVAPAFEPDIVLLDIGMPEMDGHETARRLRANNSTAVLIALTGYGQDSDRRKAQEAGFNHHLVKPVGLVELEEVFAEIPHII
jgi:signal transduction histidine kinase/CheY-like chemotaxis protein